GVTDLSENSLKVVADHIRSCAFLVVDGVAPSNEGRGYVLRRIIRRALRHGHNLGASGSFFHKLVVALGEVMGEAYPELLSMQQEIIATIKKEEEQFARTLDKGMGVLEAALENLSGEQLPGELIFQLYDTFGFPTDLTNDIARERGYSMDMEGYEECMEAQRTRARSASQFGLDYSDSIRVAGSTEFVGYNSLQNSTDVIALYAADEEVTSAAVDTEVAVILGSTPFYAESGGQVGDSGYLQTASAKIEITDCRKAGEHHLHIGKVLSGELKVGETVTATVDCSVRTATALNHSATHLLHSALQQILGEHVNQKGSLVDSQRLRFDFSHGESISAQQIREIEHRVNREILRNTPVETEVMTMDEAVEKGAMALFGEKYGSEVRVLSMGGDFSVELCGGTHVSRTGDIGLLKISAESSVSAGVRRIEAVTGEAAIAYCDALQDTVTDVANVLRAARHSVADKALQVVEENRKLQKEIDALKSKLANASGTDLMADLREINGFSVLSTVVEGADAKSLRGVADQVRSKLQSGVFMLAAVDGDKAALVAGVTQDLTDKIKAGDLLKFVTAQVDGKGGGRADMAQGAAGSTENLAAALESVYSWVSDAS
ncbi:alanine--tRNA ligase, partial [Porticoccaceae bacterium]|nr:alanine--tRNA ligase [Porticoccaceae bacterium]